jgi:transposase
LMGRPSIDPELMIRMLVVGYVFAIRSERLICREVQVNLAYRWFCKLGIEDAIPDHSAFSRARNERFREGDVFRRVFERVVEACIAAGLVGGEGFAVDASLIEADANKQRSIAGQDWRKDRDPKSASRAVKEYLATLDDTAWGAATGVVPKFVSPSDPAAQWTGAHKGPAFFAYSDNYLIDVKFGVIVDVEASRAIRQAEVGAAKTMIERTEIKTSGRWDAVTTKIKRLAANPGSGNEWYVQLFGALCYQVLSEYHLMENAYGDGRQNASLLAWRARNLLELSVWSRYFAKGREEARRIYEDAGRDALDIFGAFEKWGQTTVQSSDWLDPKRTCRDGLTMSALEGTTDLPF